MALSSLPGNQLYERACLIASQADLRKSPHDWFREVEFPVIAKFTWMQLAIAVLIYVVTWTPVSMTFPLFIAALVYVRLKVLPKYFDAATLLLLDPLIELAPEDAPKKSASSSNLMAEGGAELVTA